MAKFRKIFLTLSAIILSSSLTLVAQTNELFVKAEMLNLREEATTSSRIVAKLPRNTKIHLVFLLDDWALVRTSKMETGYVKASYLSTGAVVARTTAHDTKKPSRSAPPTTRQARAAPATTHSHSSNPRPSSSRVTVAPRRREGKVYICMSRSSYAYHSSNCRGLNRCKSGVSTVTVSEAQESGYQDCKICY